MSAYGAWCCCRCCCNLHATDTAITKSLSRTRVYAASFNPTGVVDPLGVMPLLRRGVKNIIACVATRTEPTVSLEQFAIGKS